MSITPPTGILDITDAIVRVSKLEFRGATGFDTILNNVARNTILLVDQNVEYTSSNSWALKLPNAWVAEFDAYWASGASGNIDFNVYNDVTSGTNGYTISMDDTTITVAYDGGSALETVTLGSTLKNDTWRKIHVLFERDMISLALDGTRVLYFKDTLIRPRVYDEDSGYVVASGLSANRKFKNLRIMNGDKWMTDTTSNIAYVHGNVGIGTTQAAYTLDVKGDIRATGNLLIEGLTTTVDTQNLSIEDAIVEIGRGNDGGTSGKDVGFLFTRNDGTNTTNSNVALIYDESTDRLTLGYSDGSPTDSTLAINTSKSLDVVIPSGNVGIGTNNPRNMLEVRGGDGTASDTYATFGKLVQASAGWSGIRLGTPYQSAHDAYCSVIESYNDHSSNYNSELRFKTSSGDNAEAGERMRITSQGNVGIGTNNPLSTLQVGNGTGPTTGNASGSITVHGTGATKSNGGLPGIYHRANVGLGLWSDSVMSFEVAGNTGTPVDAMRITNTGNVGIGTADPNQGNLTVYALGADPYFSGFNQLDYADATDFTGLAHFKSSGSHGAIRVSNNADNTGTTRIDFNTKLSDYWGTNIPSNSYFRGTAPTAGRIMVSGEIGNNYEDSYMTFHTCRDLRPDGSGGTGNLYERMRITSTGNVGIGTANPATKFHVFDNTTYDLRMRNTSKTSVIGTPSYSSIDLTDESLHGGFIEGIHDANVTHGLRLGGYSNGTRDAPAIFIRGGTGNVGIGTTSPSQKLTIEGTGVSSQTRINGDGYVGRYYNSGGNRGSSVHFTSDAVIPSDYDFNLNDGSIELGWATYRWAQIYSTSSTISTSDRNKKQDITDISSSERKVASKIIPLLKTFRMKDAVAKKGDDARIHTGVIAQDLIAVFDSEGLDAHRYGLFCYDEKWTVDGEHELSEIVHENDGEGGGVKNMKRKTGSFANKDTPGAVLDSTIYSIRYEELLCFIASAMVTNEELQAEKAKVTTLETQLASVLARLDALESA